MNYFMKCQLLSEGFKHEQLHEQLIEEDWEKLKKELTDLYVAGKITERQISTRLARAGMGSLSKNTAYKIAHDPENFQKREAVFSRARKEEEEKAKEEAKAAQVAKHQTRGFAAANYSSQANMDAWLKAANEYRARKEKERAAKKVSLRESFNEEKVNYIMENIYMDNEELKCLLEDTAQYLLENNGPKKFVKGLKKAALGILVAPGIVGGVKNVKNQADYRAMDKAKNAYNREMKQKEVNARQNEIAQKLHNTGVEFIDSAKEAGREAGKAIQSGYEKAKPIVKKFANKSKEELKELYEKGKISLEDYRAAKKEARAAKKAAGETVNEEVNYFNY